MGLSTMIVRFPDGAIRFGCYQDTADVPYQRLFDELPSPLPPGALDGEPEGNSGEEVEVAIYCNYGGGFHWEGRARGLWLTDTGMDPETWDLRGMEHGEPAWLPDELR